MGRPLQTMNSAGFGTVTLQGQCCVAAPLRRLQCRQAMVSGDWRAAMQLVQLGKSLGVLPSGKVLEQGTAHRLLKAAAHQGDVEAMRELGLAYYYGHGTRENCQHGMRMLGAAAEAGDVEAICSLGLCYLEGSAVPQNVAAALERFSAAAELGHSRALLCAGRAWLKLGEHREALEAFRRAALQGVRAAHWHVAVMLETGLGVARDPDGARLHYDLARSEPGEPGEVKGEVKGETELLRTALAGQVSSAPQPPSLPPKVPLESHWHAHGACTASHGTACLSR
jgi:tetratricopeptide (TPR) repeat protein